MGKFCLRCPKGMAADPPAARQEPSEGTLFHGGKDLAPARRFGKAPGKPHDPVIAVQYGLSLGQMCSEAAGERTEPRVLGHERPIHP